MLYAVDIGGRAANAFTVLMEWLPRLLGAVVVLLIGWLVARIVASLLANVLHRVGFDRTVHAGQGGRMIQRVVGRPSALVGKVVFWAILLGAVSLAASVLGIAALTAFIGAVWAYLPNVVAAVAIFLVAGLLSAGIATFVERTMGDTLLGRIAKTAAPILIMGIATFMILDQLKIAQDIVAITYAVLLGSIGLGTALAFGLGGRDLAQRTLEGAADKVSEHEDELAEDASRGLGRAREEAQRLREQASGASAGASGESREA
jgi:hypothetical protein